MIKFHHPLRATEHRVLVLWSVATSPIPATMETILADCCSATFTRNQVGIMVYQLVKERLLGRTRPYSMIGERIAMLNPPSTYFLTDEGLRWLTKTIQKPHTRRSRKKEKA